jgi:GxxExxY protein
MMKENRIGEIIIAAAIQLHRELGPGLLESVYEMTLAHDLRERGLAVERQVPIGVNLRGIRFEEGFRADLIINRKVLIEVKSTDKINNAHRKQVLTYLRLTGLRLGYLLNFGNGLMKDGIIRVANHLEEAR